MMAYSKIRPAWLLVGSLLMSVISFAAAAEPGVVVDRVTKYSEAEKSGLQPGDIIVRWSRGEAKGEIESPFDLSATEVEQAPRGAVTIEGLHGAELQHWSLGPGDWGIVSRPILSEPVLQLYRDGQELVAARKFTEAAARWRAAVGHAESFNPPWLRAWLLFRAGELFSSAGQWKPADEAYQEAVQQASGSGPLITAQLQRARANTFQQQRDWVNAERYFQESLTETRKLGAESLLTAASINDLGKMIEWRGDLDKAEECYLQALTIREKIAPASLAVAVSLNDLGVIARFRNDFDKSEEYHRRALDIQKKLAPDSLVVAASLSNMGILAYEQGDLAEAEDYASKAYAIRSKLAPDNFAFLTNLGNIVKDRGDLVKAETYYRQALAAIERKFGNGIDHAGTLHNLGNVALARGDLAGAEDWYRQALTIGEKLAPRGVLVSYALFDLGSIATERGDLAKAEDYLNQSLAIRNKLVPESLMVAEDLLGLGVVARQRHDLDKAEEYFSRALVIHQKLAPRKVSMAEILQKLGELTQDRGDLAKAEEYYRQALEITKTLAESEQHAQALAALASIQRRKGQSDVAAQFFDQALSALESQTAHLGGADETRSNFRAQHAAYYSDYVDLLLAQNETEHAFQVLERSRARGLLEILTAAHVDIHKGLDPELLQRERSLQDSITTKLNRRIQLLGDKHTEEQAAAINKEIEGLLAQYKDLEEQIRVSSPGYAALTQPQPLSARQIQQEFLDANTVLLEYILADKRSYVFAVTSTSLVAYELPGRAEIEAAARRVYDALTARNRVEKGESDVEKLIRTKTADTQYLEAARALSRMILAPITPLVPGKRLMIVSDGVLQYIPFAALPSPHSTAAGWKPLAVEHEVVNLPSASILEVLRQQAAGRSRASKAVAVLADPVFSADDLRLKSVKRTGEGISVASRGQSETKGASSSDVLFESFVRSSSEAGASRTVQFPRLFFTRKEAEAVLRQVSHGDAMKALDFDASRATATSPELAQYRIIHFATHGVLNSEHPELSGLVLSLVDVQGKQQNGFLWLGDIYNLNLSADLVVLSACETGLGKQIKGEGLLGITRGFMYAGAPRVIASLWKIDDAATAELMGRFYRGMLQDGLEPAGALQRAQVEMWKQKRWKSPYYWAGFVMQGPW